MEKSGAQLGPKREFRTVLDSGHKILVRPIEKSDKPLIAQAIHDLSDQSRYMRFFTAFRDAPEPILELLASVDGVDHIAWGAVDLEEAGRPIAAVHAIRGNSDETEVEIACTVMDEYHGHGISHLLLAATVFDCLKLGIEEAHAEVLFSNHKAKGLFVGLDAKLVDSEDDLMFWMDLKAVLQKIEEKSHPNTLHEFMAALRAE